MKLRRAKRVHPVAMAHQSVERLALGIHATQHSRHVRKKYAVTATMVPAVAISMSRCAWCLAWKPSDGNSSCARFTPNTYYAWANRIGVRNKALIAEVFYPQGALPLVGGGVPAKLCIN